MINELRKEFSTDKIKIMSLNQLHTEMAGISDIIFDEYLNDLDNTATPDEHYRNDTSYQILNKIKLDLKSEITKKTTDISGIRDQGIL